MGKNAGVYQVFPFAAPHFLKRLKRNALYHVTAHGDRREDIFEDDVDRKLFLETLIHFGQVLQSCKVYFPSN